MIKIFNIKRNGSIISLSYKSDTGSGDIVFDINKRKLISGEDCIDWYDFGLIANRIQRYIDEGKDIPSWDCMNFY